MSVMILDMIAEYTDRTTGNRQIRAQLIADTVTDLPSNSTALTYLLGSYARVIDTGKEYYIDSSGTWIEQPSGISLDLTGYYTAAETDVLLSGKQDSLTLTQLAAVNSGITAADCVKIEMPSSDITEAILDKNYNCRTVGYANTVAGKGGWCYVDTIILNSTATRRMEKAYFSDGEIKTRFFGLGGLEEWGNWV